MSMEQDTMHVYQQPLPACKAIDSQRSTKKTNPSCTAVGQLQGLFKQHLFLPKLFHAQVNASTNEIV